LIGTGKYNSRRFVATLFFGDDGVPVAIVIESKASGNQRAQQQSFYRRHKY
jgi:hypothetical protein